jgi:hypothetical protein
MDDISPHSTIRTGLGRRLQPSEEIATTSPDRSASLVATDKAEPWGGFYHVSPIHPRRVIIFTALLMSISA